MFNRFVHKARSLFNLTNNVETTIIFNDPPALPIGVTNENQQISTKTTGKHVGSMKGVYDDEYLDPMEDVEIHSLYSTKDFSYANPTLLTTDYVRKTLKKTLVEALNEIDYVKFKNKIISITDLKDQSFVLANLTTKLKEYISRELLTAEKFDGNFINCIIINSCPIFRPKKEDGANTSLFIKQIILKYNGKFLEPNDAKYLIKISNKFIRRKANYIMKELFSSIGINADFNNIVYKTLTEIHNINERNDYQENPEINANLSQNYSHDDVERVQNIDTRNLELTINSASKKIYSTLSQKEPKYVIEGTLQHNCRSLSNLFLQMEKEHKKIIELFPEKYEEIKTNLVKLCKEKQNAITGIEYFYIYWNLKNIVLEDKENQEQINNTADDIVKFKNKLRLLEDQQEINQKNAAIENRKAWIQFWNNFTHVGVRSVGGKKTRKQRKRKTKKQKKKSNKKTKSRR